MSNYTFFLGVGTEPRAWNVPVKPGEYGVSGQQVIKRKKAAKLTTCATRLANSFSQAW